MGRVALEALPSGLPCSYPHARVAPCLLPQAGVNLNVKDRSGDTPADDAMIQHHEEALKLILEVRRRGVFSHA